MLDANVHICEHYTKMAPLLENIKKLVYTHHGTKDHNKLVIMVDRHQTVFFLEFVSDSMI